MSLIRWYPFIQICLASVFVMMLGYYTQYFTHITDIDKSLIYNTLKPGLRLSVTEY
jgi:hypothetical protein